MHPTHARKIPVDELDHYRAGLRRQVRRSARDLLLFQAFYFLALAGLTVLGVAVLAFGGFIAGFLLGLVSWSFYRSQVRAHEIRQRRLTWLDTLLGELHDDLAPTEKLRVRYDLQPGDSWRYLVRSTRSSAGNNKTHYRNRWLRVRGMLADGTRFRIRVQSVAKSKKGQLIREQGGLILEVTRPAHRAALAVGMAPDSPAETRPWGMGSITLEPAHGRLVFRFQAHENALLDQLYQALRFAVALDPGRADGKPTPGSPA